MLTFGFLLLGITAFLFAGVSKVWEFYLVQAIRGIAMAFYAATWTVIFSKHLDKKREAFEWSLDSMAVGIGAGLSGLMGSVIAESFGYYTLFVVVGIMSLMGAAILMLVPDIVLPRKSFKEVFSFKDHDKFLPHT